jgi:hypothetical protein
MTGRLTYIYDGYVRNWKQTRRIRVTSLRSVDTVINLSDDLAEMLR